MSKNKKQTVATVKYTVDDSGKLLSTSGSSEVDVPPAGFYVNSDVGLIKDYTPEGDPKTDSSETIYHDKNPLFGVSALSKSQYKYEWLENLWCDQLAHPELVEMFATADGLTDNQKSLFKPFSNSIGSLLAVETIKDTANTPVSEMSSSNNIIDSDNSTTGALMYDSISYVERNPGEVGPIKTPNRSSIDTTKIMKNFVDDIFNRNMALIKDPKFWNKSTELFESLPINRSDGTGVSDSGIKIGHAHGGNLITDTKHYDRMHSVYDTLKGVIRTELGEDVFGIWQYRRARSRIGKYIEPLIITFPVERIPTRLDGYTFDPIVQYIDSNGYITAAKPKTNNQILGITPISED